MSFKKLLIFICLGLFSASGMAAEDKSQEKTAESKFKKYQESRKSHFQITPVGGLNTMGFQGTVYDPEGNEREFIAEEGTSAGVLVDFNTRLNGLAMQWGFIHQQTNSSYVSQVGGEEQKTIYEDSYIALPIAAKYYPFSRASRWLYLKSGVSINALLDSKRKVGRGTGEISSSNLVSEDSLVEKRRQFDIQGTVGLGVSIPISRYLGVGIEANYHHGLVDTLENPAEVQNSQVRTQGYSGMLGIIFRL